MACEDGQEAHLVAARELDGRHRGIARKFGEIGDTQLTVMAALTIADELGEMGPISQEELAAPGRAARRSQQKHASRDRGGHDVGHQGRIESIAKKLKASATATASPG